jgi:hypothetical protein
VRKIGGCLAAAQAGISPLGGAAPSVRRAIVEKLGPLRRVRMIAERWDVYVKLAIRLGCDESGPRLSAALAADPTRRRKICGDVCVISGRRTQWAA